MSRFIAFLALALLVTGSVSADVMLLHGTTGAYSLDAEVDFDVVNSKEVTVTLTNVTTNAGDIARTTYFGLQMPTSGMTVTVDPNSDSMPWTTANNASLPGSGNDTFNWLFSHTGGGLPGLKYTDQLILHFTSLTDIFNPLDLSTWTPTDKNGLLAEVKFQSVGDNLVSGEAYTSDPNINPNPNVVPEPSVLALVGLGMAFMLPRGRKNREIKA